MIDIYLFKILFLSFCLFFYLIFLLLYTLYGNNLIHAVLYLMVTDFQQIELRLLAHLANDSTLLRLFNESCEKDIFVELTAQWYVS